MTAQGGALRSEWLRVQPKNVEPFSRCAPDNPFRGLARLARPRPNARGGIRDGRNASSAFPRPFSRIEFLDLTARASEANRFCDLRAQLGVVMGNHRIVRRQAVAFAVALRV